LVADYVADFHESTVVTALFATGAVVVSLAIYAMTTKTEIEYFHSLIVMGSMSILSLWLVSFFVPSASFLIGLIASLLSGLYLIYDIKMIMGNDRRKIGVDDYMLASIMIYIDIIRIFMEILKYINAAQEKDKKKK